MKVVYCGQFRLPNYDAAAPRVLNNARAMRMAGNEVFFISWGGKYREADKCDDGKYRIDGMEYEITNEIDFEGSYISRIMQAMHRGKKTLEILTNMKIKPDVVVTYNAGYRFTKQIKRFCKNAQIKLVNDLTEWYANNELHFWDIIPNLINMKWLQQKVKNKICISSFLDSYYTKTNNIVIPPLCDFSEKKWKEEIDDPRVVQFDGLSLIYAGNPARKDSVHTIINVVNNLSNEGYPIRFIIIGITKEQYLSRYANLLIEKILNDNIIFLGRINQDLIPSYYNKSDFMVLLREHNRKNMAGFPTKFAEAITSGVPVIANATSDLDKYIIDGETGFLLKNDEPEELKITLIKILNLEKHVYAVIKDNVRSMKNVFNYTSYQYELNQFLNNLQ